MRRVLIVGANSGIGRQLAGRLAGEAQLWTASRSATSEQDARHLAWDAADAAVPFPADGLPDALDGLVYCPGSIRLMPFERIGDAAFREDFELNLMGAVRAIRAALPALKAAPQASIVLFSTVAVGTGMPMHAAVAAAKGAVEGLTRSLAAEFAPGIRVNAIAPSLSDTPLAGKLLKTDRQREAAAARHPLERVGQAEDIAAAARFLLSDESSWMTGQVVHVDGGMGALRRFN
ncbi:MAG: SDR family oxidoreductase [Sedimenticolaceae bacterium]